MSTASPQSVLQACTATCRKAPEGADAPQTPDDMKRRIAQLEAENARLQGDKAPKKAKTEPEGAAKKIKTTKRQRRAIARKQLAADEAAGINRPPAAVLAQAADPAAILDLSAWDDYGLHESVVAQLGQQGFTAPTPIQHACLPAAVLGHADIIGAAQTVRDPDTCLNFW